MTHSEFSEVTPGSAPSVIIPTLNPGTRLSTLIGKLEVQSLKPCEIIILDSESTDGSIGSSVNSGTTRIIQIPRAQFHHASTRNHGARLAVGSFLVFMTQDAIPTDERLLERLIEALKSGAAGAYARQVPLPDASPLAAYARTANYPPLHQLDREPSASGTSIREVFFSNSCSAIRRDIFEIMGGFPTHTIMNEDMVFAARLIQNGYRVAYVPDAIVEHSHNYSISQTFRRYFDIGVVLYQAREELAGRRLTREGLRYIHGLFTTLWRDKNYSWIPVAFLESAAKWVGTFLGKRHRRLPISVVRMLSLHRSYWDGAGREELLSL